MYTRFLIFLTTPPPQLYAFLVTRSRDIIGESPAVVQPGLLELDDEEAVDAALLLIQESCHELVYELAASAVEARRYQLSAPTPAQAPLPRPAPLSEDHSSAPVIDLAVPTSPPSFTPLEAPGDLPVLGLSPPAAIEPSRKFSMDLDIPDSPGLISVHRPGGNEFVSAAAPRFPSKLNLDAPSPLPSVTHPAISPLNLSKGPSSLSSALLNPVSMSSLPSSSFSSLSHSSAYKTTSSIPSPRSKLPLKTEGVGASLRRRLQQAQAGEIPSKLRKF